MAAAVLPYPRQGILLNPSPSSYNAPLPASSSTSSPYVSSSWSRRSPPPSLEQPASSSSSASSVAGSTPPTPRGSPKSRPAPRIRFAPLPDPQRGVLITDDGEELPLPRLYDDDSDDEHSSSPPESVLDDKAAPNLDWVSANAPSQDASLAPALWGTPSASPRPVLAQLPEDETVQTCSTPSSPFISKTRRLLKLALPLPSRGLDLRLTPSASSASASSDVFSGGMSALFRVGSRDSSRTSGSRASSRERLADDSSSALGAPLGRCSSAASAASGRSTSTLRPSLLAFRRTQSSDNVEKLRSASSSGSTTPRSGRPAARAVSAQQGTRMLNGRVYGGRRGHQFKTNPFETARNEEPEFVEWGYGGMGSNKTAKDSAITSKYAALHGGASTGDDDDGSGLAWLKARREKRAAEEAAKAAAAAAGEKPESAEPSAAGDEKKKGQSEAVSTPAPAETSVESSPHPASSAPAQAKKMPEYVHNTVTLPASSALPTVHEGIVSGSEDAKAASSVSVTTVSEEGSSSSEEEEEERSSEGTSPEEEEDEEMVEAIRKTSVCAGVEKVSRHKE